jgi:hypothetical protein
VQAERILREAESADVELRAMLIRAERDLSPEEYAKLRRFVRTRQEQSHEKSRRWWREHGLDVRDLESVFERFDAGMDDA